jgi:large subunit ribosomal protein L29
MKKADIKNLSAGDIQNSITEAKAQYSKLKLAHNQPN